MRMEDMFNLVEQDATRIVDEVCNRLKAKQKQCTDRNIVTELMRMTRDEIIRAIS